ncbi:MAG: VanW family protein [Chloroflexota bacterium]
MAQPARQPLHANVPERVRREELIRPADRRRDFPKREAQRRLQQKETQWAPIAYAVFLAAILLIAGFAYTTYAFSRYRGEILPGTHVDQVQLGGLTDKQAYRALLAPTLATHLVPVQLTYPNFRPWQPTYDDLGLQYKVDDTVKEAMPVGRQGSIIEQLIDRLPIHPSHGVPLLYVADDRKIRTFVERSIGRRLTVAPINARLVRHGNDFVLVPASEGASLDVNAAIVAIHSALGSLNTQSERLQVIHQSPTVANSDVRRVRARVERFLNHTPIINIGKRVFVTNRAAFVPMLSFSDRKMKGRTAIVMAVDPNAVHSYVASLAAQIDRPALNAKLVFDAGKVLVVRPLQTGRTLDQVTAYSSLLHVVTNLKPNARLHVPVSTQNPPIDKSDPASLGISTLLGSGQSSFVGAGTKRLDDVNRIALALNNVEIPPSGDISFNTLVTTNWPDRVYADGERDQNGQPVPGNSGAMQQVATTFLRAMYGSGMMLLERHAHTHRLPWYEPPTGLDAVVAPGRNWDLRFTNNAHKSLLIETRVEPLRQELYIYVYGPKLGWHVSVSNGKVTKIFPHGAQVVQQDPTLSPGDVRQISWAHDGAKVVVQRTIAYPNGNLHVDRVTTRYQASRAIVSVGSAVKQTATPSPTPTATSRSKVRVTPSPIPTLNPSPTPSPASPTPTFSH